MTPLDLVQLRGLMNRTSGTSEIRIGLIDGPVALDHPALARENIRRLGGTHDACQTNVAACVHGTAVAGILSAGEGRRHQRSARAARCCCDPFRRTRRGGA
jgi:hypothetical protein